MAFSPAAITALSKPSCAGTDYRKGSAAARRIQQFEKLMHDARLENQKVEIESLRAQELTNLVSLRQRKVDRIAKAVEQKLPPPTDVERARKSLAETKKRLADAEK